MSALLGARIVAKGINFPGVRRVGVVLADTRLHLPDFQAAARVFSLLVQVAGRAAGRNLGVLFILLRLKQ
jgi:primosomal protein N' (replication factor Y)